MAGQTGHTLHTRLEYFNGYSYERQSTTSGESFIGAGSVMTSRTNPKLQT